MAEAMSDMQIFPGLTLSELDELETVFIRAEDAGLDESQIVLRAKFLDYRAKLARYADLCLPVPDLWRL